jgi:HlyD family secretion protein
MLNRKTALIILMAALGLASAILVLSGRTARASEQLRVSTDVPASHAAAAQGLQVIGTFVAPNQATLAFRAGGRIQDIKVQEGAQVKAGDVLAVVDTTALQLNVAQAKTAVTLAQDRLTQIKNGATESDLTASRAALDASQQNYAKVAAGPTANDLAPLKAQLDTAKAALDQAQSTYDRAGGASNPYIGQLPQSLQLQQATNNYSAALAAYNNARSHPTAAELAGAAAQVQQAAAAQARLQPTSDNLQIAQDQVDQAQAALALAQQQVADATLTAPSDGTVIWLGPHIGEMATPGAPVLILADLTHLQLQAGVDETSLALIQVGQTVSILPEAFKDKTIGGKVSRIGWLAATTSGVINVPVTIDVNTGDVPLRPGLSATAEIQTSQQ